MRYYCLSNNINFLILRQRMAFSRFLQLLALGVYSHEAIFEKTKSDVISVDIKNHEEWIICLYSSHLSVDCRLYLNNLGLCNQRYSTFSISHQN